MFAKKEYRCDHCQQTIKIDDLYLFGKGRGPRYLDDDINCEDTQVGIEYYQYRLCLREDCGDP